MKNSRMKLVNCSDRSVWDAFVDASPQGNVFCRSAFLPLLNVGHDFLLLLQGKKPLAAVVVLHMNGQPIRAPHLFTMYQGILLDGSIAQAPLHRRPCLSIAATQFLLGELCLLYDRVSFCLHHSFQDLRGFQWFNYDRPERGLFTVDLRYTGLVDLTKYGNFSEYLMDIRKLRQREYFLGLKNNLTVESSQDVATFVDLHRKTFERQGLRVEKTQTDLVRRITDGVLREGLGELLLCRNGEGTVASATLFLSDKQSGYYLFGANDPQFRDIHTGAFLMLENIRRCMAKGLKKVDMVGVNSPRRGDFKVSFNARVVPYYIVSWERPASDSAANLGARNDGVIAEAEGPKRYV